MAKPHVIGLNRTMTPRLAFIFLFLPLFVQAFEIPTNLDREDRKELTQMLGPTSSLKTLTRPFPLGGYDGFELGMSLETVDVSTIDSLGAGTTEESSLVIPKVTFAKGLYFDLDVFLEFSPLLRQEKVSEFGLLIRKSLYQSKYYPINLSLSLFGNAANVDNIFTSETYGYDFTGGVTLYDISVYLGLGVVSTKARIIGAKESLNITDTGQNEEESLEQLHTVFGMSYDFENVFLAFQADRYKVPVYSVKLGYRL